ncbi:MAG: hypothetical protein CO128_07770 [Ignavibacteriales bacterium CG_4_9_14_3_um_filter_30_11]|nr:MAG: hypothetical protein CO128_07770 [Ignavibacteriales bacterium CG_4_9_14_3_um_filter_30_11]
MKILIVFFILSVDKLVVMLITIGLIWKFNALFSIFQYSNRNFLTIVYPEGNHLFFYATHSYNYSI